MTNQLLPQLLAACIGLTGLVATSQAQSLVLSGTNYFQNFDEISTLGLPGEWALYTGASVSALGSLATLRSGPTNGWGDTSGAFKNFASTISNEGTNFLGGESVAIQNAATNRALGIRQTGTFGDPGAAFALKIADTIGFGNFELNLDFLLLSVQGRSNVWAVDFGVSPDGSSPPSSFTTVASNAYVALSTASTPVGVFGSSNRTISFGSLLDNQPGPIWIRVVNYIPSGGSGSRPSFAIDNFSLSYQPVAPVTNPVVIVTQPASNTVYVGDNTTLSVSVTGSAPISYQWYHPDLNTPVGGNSASYFINGITTNNAGLYWVVVSGPINTVTSSPALLTVLERTPIVTNIAYLRTLQTFEVNAYVPIDTTNLYTVEGIVITRTNVTTAANTLFYMVDPSDNVGIPVFISGDSTTRPQRGDRVRVTGPLGQFNNLFEFNMLASNPTHTVTNLSSGNPVPDPKVFQFSFLTNLALMETNYEGSLVVVSNVYFQRGGATNFVGGGTLVLTNLLGQTMQFFCDARLADIIGQPVPVFASSITGYISQFQLNHQIVPTWLADIVPGTPPAPGPTPEPIIFSTSGGNLVLSWTQPGWKLATGTDIFSVTNIISGATSPYTNNLGDAQRYFRLVYP